jgi:hypothetical protein
MADKPGLAHGAAMKPRMIAEAERCRAFLVEVAEVVARVHRHGTGIKTLAFLDRDPALRDARNRPSVGAAVGGLSAHWSVCRFLAKLHDCRVAAVLKG